MCKHLLCLGTPHLSFITHTIAQYSVCARQSLFCNACHTILAVALLCKGQSSCHLLASDTTYFTTTSQTFWIDTKLRNILTLELRSISGLYVKLDVGAMQQVPLTNFRGLILK